MSRHHEDGYDYASEAEDYAEAHAVGAQTAENQYADWVGGDR